MKLNLWLRTMCFRR